MREMIFLFPNFFEDRDYERFGIALLEKRGMRIKIWSVVYLLSTSAYIKPLQRKAEIIDVYYPRGIKELLLNIKKNKEKEFLLLLNHDNLRNIRKQLCLQKSIYYELKICPALFYDEEFFRQPLWRKIKYQFIYEHKSIREIADYYMAKIYQIDVEKALFHMQLLYNPPKAVFYSVEADKYKMPAILRSCRHYSFQALDYDIYLDLIHTSKRIIDKKYFLYIDDGEVTLHPDNVHYGQQVNTKKEVNNYITHIRKFLDRIESCYHIEIVVAGHPRVQYRGDEFGNRRIVQFKTGQLVKEAEVAIISRSSAWNFIILYHKPVLFYRQPDRKFKLDMEIMETYLNRKAYDISNSDENILRNAIKQIDTTTSKKYYKDYIKGKDSKHEYFFEAFARIIENIKRSY